jgi:hypothetical protein
MFLSEDLLFKLTIVLAVWVVYLFVISFLVKAKNAGQTKKMHQTVQMRQDLEKLRLEMKINAKDYERIGRYEEAAILYKELGDPEKARKCQMLTRYIIELSESE